MSQNPPVDALFSKYLESLKLKESIKSGMAKEMISKIGNPSNLLIHYDLMFISLFMENKVVIGNLHKKTIIPFVEGQYCKKSSTGLAICGILDGPWGMVIKNDIFYVTSFGSDQVLAFSVSSGEFSYAFGDSETLDCPEGIAIDNNRIFVVNYGSSNVAIFDLNHQFIRYLVTRTQVPYLRGPESILLDPEHNHIAITSYANNSLVILNYDGQLQRVVRDIDFPPEVVFAGPIGLALSFKGTYVVTCYKSHSVHELNADGSYISTLADITTERRLRGPTGIFFLHRSFFVASYDNRKVLIFNQTTTGTHRTALLIDGSFLRHTHFTA